MSVKWTKEQQQVIDLQKRNILVSAAAGSGKTAVLVERILQMITRKDDPVDIDRLLVVTFTRAAAGEMRERLMAAVEKQLETEPDNEHLQRQQTLIHNAQINTIDGFCAYVIKNYFHTIDLDPGFRVANEGELQLLKQDVVKELLENEYTSETEDFCQFVETFATGKTDEGLGDMILRLYEFSMSNPWPEEWLQECEKVYEKQDFQEVQKTVWMKKMWEDTEKQLDSVEDWNSMCRKICGKPDGPYAYLDAVDDDLIFIKKLREQSRQQDYDSCCSLFKNMKFAALSRKKDENVSEVLKDRVKAYRQSMKDSLGKLREKYFYGSSHQVMEELQMCQIPVKELIRLTEEFIRMFGEKKRKRNLLDFTDMEHLALDILVRKEEGELKYTAAADEFSLRFEEILIDEYQDSNMVQEMLMRSVSRIRKGQNNIFMVGDVKQSIYRFRLARPELFMEKYETYTKEDSDCQKIDLHKNFRSRAEVLEFINHIFKQIMSRTLGDVEYDEQAALYPGALFPQLPENAKAAQIMMIDTSGQEEGAEDVQEDSVQEMEARAIGARIRELVDHEQVIDKQTGEYRPVEYRDCVVLLRTLSGWADTFVRVLMDMGIPAYTSSKTGYFGTTEVRTILNYLHICDNPRQEIPFTGVLLSPIGNFTPEELAMIKSRFPDEKIFDCAKMYVLSGENASLREKLERFYHIYDTVREKVPYTPIHELIQFILKITGYSEYAMALPGGKQRKANLKMLVEKAIEYESTSYRGLFNFVRYIEQLQKYQVDFGEVSTIGENENTVRIMSIHKSKGLEFPIVFASGMGKRFNMMDANTSLIIHPDLGIGTNGADPERRIKITTLIHNVMQKQIRLETLGEELRILYVACTRAKERLILTGTVKNLPDLIEELFTLTDRKEEKLSYGTIASASEYWDWILPALARHKDFNRVYKKYGYASANTTEIPEVSFDAQIIYPMGLICEEVDQQITGQERYDEYTGWDENSRFDEDTENILREKFSYKYPYEYLQDIPAKLSVSQLKHEAMEENEAYPLIKEEEIVPVIPGFMQEEKEEGGAARGTAYHRIMELLDYEKTACREEIRSQIDKMEEKNQIDEFTSSGVRVDKIMRFVESSLGVRMKTAFLKNKLYREQPFVMSIPAEIRNPAWGKEPILVQGIIDAFFEEDGEIVLVDYKTDRLTEKGEEELISRYKVQLQYYAMALERVTGKKVKEAYLYSFYLGKPVQVILDE